MRDHILEPDILEPWEKWEHALQQKDKEIADLKARLARVREELAKRPETMRTWRKLAALAAAQPEKEEK